MSELRMTERTESPHTGMTPPAAATGRPAGAARMPASAPPVISAGRALLLLDLFAAAILWPALAWLVLTGDLRPDAFRLAIYPVGWLTFLLAFGLYRREALVSTRKSLNRAALAALLGVVAGALTARIAPDALAPPTASTASIFSLALAAFVIFGALNRAVVFALRQHGALRRRVLIIGAGQRAWDLALLLRREGRSVAYELTFVDIGGRDPRMMEEDADRVTTARDEDFVSLAIGAAADEIVIAPDDRRGLPMRALLACKTSGFPVTEYMRFLEREIGRIDIKRLELGWLLHADGFTFSPISRVLKRALDLAASAAVLLVAGPALLAAMLAVKLDDRGPVFYRQTRVTQGGREFRILKLRTMRVDAERFGAVWAAEKDPRITRIGRFLRRTRLDELPQLVNVLKGDMSFVGPRPERPEFTRELAAQLPLFEERHLVKAGLTGWAQINYPYGASLDDARSKLSYDLYYVKNFGLVLDMLIILQTLRVVLWPGGVR